MEREAAGLAEIEDAARLVRTAMPPTPQYRWPLLCRRLGAELWVKHENHTPIGAFKLRGGLVYLDALKRREPAVRGVVSATRGNHGQSIAFAAGRVGLPATIGTGGIEIQIFRRADRVRQHNVDRPADDLFGRIAEQPLGRAVKAADDLVPVDDGYRVDGGVQRGAIDHVGIAASEARGARRRAQRNRPIAAASETPHASTLDQPTERSS